MLNKIKHKSESDGSSLSSPQEDNDDVKNTSIPQKSDPEIGKQNIANLDEEEISPWIIYTTPKFMAMPASYFAVGVIFGGQGAILFPLYQLILDSPQNYQNSVKNVISLFWSFKIFYGFLSDSVPIRGQRRKPYIVFGWVMSTIMTAIQAIFIHSQETQLYCFDGNGQLLSDASQSINSCPNGTTFQTTSVSSDFDGNSYVALMILTNFFYMFAEVANDGLAVQYARFEPEKKRGALQSYNYAIRFASTCMTYIITSFSLNTPLFGGTFTKGLSVSSFLWVLTAGQAITLPFYFIMEEKRVNDEEITSILYKLGLLWKLLQNKAFACLMIFNVCYGIFTGVTVVGLNGLAEYWVGVSGLQYNLSSIFIYVTITLAVYVNGKCLVGYSWRCLQSFGLVTATIMGLLTLIIVYDIERSPWFWMFTGVDIVIFSLVGYVVSIWAVTEMSPGGKDDPNGAKNGLEGTALALATTASNAAVSAAVFFQNWIGSFFPLLSSAQGAIDYAKPEAEDQFANNLYIVLGVNLFALVFLWLLPNQKADARYRYNNWGSSVALGVVGIVIIGFALLYGTTTSLATLFCPCKPTWGGSGCIEDTCEFILYDNPTSPPLKAENGTIDLL